MISKLETDTKFDRYGANPSLVSGTPVISTGGYVVAAPLSVILVGMM